MALHPHAAMADASHASIIYFHVHVSAMTFTTHAPHFNGRSYSPAHMTCCPPAGPPMRYGSPPNTRLLRFILEVLHFQVRQRH